MSFGESTHQRPPVALIDLGDTLCDCTPALRAGFAELRRPGEKESDETLVPLPPHLEARRRQVLYARGFWQALAPRPEGFKLLDLLHEEGFQVHVLTRGPHDAPHVWSEKVAWCRKHLPGISVTVTDDKSRVQGEVLVDDWLPYVYAWQARWVTGVAVVPAQPWNVAAVAAPGCVRYDGSNESAVAAALQACRKVRRESMSSPVDHGTGQQLATSSIAHDNHKEDPS